MKLIIGNLKMNLDNKEIDNYMDYFGEKNYSNVFFAPSNIYLSKFVSRGLNTISQDVSGYLDGAYTGDVSAKQLKSIGIEYSLVGHSERRKYYHDEILVNEKLKRLFEQSMTPILCIGESLEERKEKRYLNKIQSDLEDAIKDISKENIEKIIIAYEPVWSIGTGEVPTNMEIEEVANFIKKYIYDIYDINIKVLYGGSVNNEVIGELNKIESIDGYLVGGCSLKIEAFDKLINQII